MRSLVVMDASVRVLSCCLPVLGAESSLIYLTHLLRNFPLVSQGFYRKRWYVYAVLLLHFYKDHAVVLSTHSKAGEGQACSSSSQRLRLGILWDKDICYSQRLKVMPEIEKIEPLIAVVDFHHAR